MTSYYTRPFTLLEVLIVISLLSTIGGFGAVKVAHFLQERAHAVEKEVVEARYNLTGKVATLCNTRVTLSVEGKTLYLSENRKIPQGLRSLIERPFKNPCEESKRETFSPYGLPASKAPLYPYEGT